MPAPPYDCTRCGACCLNPPENVAEGYSEYVEIEARDGLRAKPELVRRYARERDGRLHMRITSDQRCLALAGRVGQRVRCSIYHERPSPCRRVHAGSDLCRRYRRDQNIDRRSC